MLRLAARIQTERAHLVEPLGLTVGDFDVLATIRRAGEITGTEISSAVMITAGGITKRLDRLEDRALITRTPNPSDRRSTFITLTPKGNESVDAAYDLVMTTESALISNTLDTNEQRQAEKSLRALLRATVELTPYHDE